MRIQRLTLPAVALTALLLAPAPPAAAVDIHDTRLLTDPAVSRDHIAFVYAGDLWVAGIDGSDPHRVASDVGREARPRFSPDGETLAFSAEYDGNIDVYTVPVEGGVPTRLTWHPGPDVVQGFTADGSAVLFTSPRAVFTRRYVQLFTVPLAGGFPTELPIPHAYRATYSPDGSKIAYVPDREAFRVWKHYRGGTAARIWLYDTADHSVEQIPQPPGRSNDTEPTWLGDRVYFLSDRNGELNLFSYDPASKAVAQLTSHDDFPVVHASGGAGHILYEQAGYLHLFDVATGESHKLTVGVAADLPATRPRYVKGARYLRGFTLSPSGARAAFDFRGEIVTVPAEKGNPRNLTRSPGAHEREPAWSPDGRSIAYFSDASGENRLEVAPQDGSGEVRSFELGGAGFYDDPKWSPDSRKISFTDNSWSLYWIDLDSGKVTKVSQETLYGPVKTLHHAWSPDSRWIAYTRNSDTNFDRVYLYSLEEGRSYPVTDGLADAGEPVFDAGGRYLYFFASTDAGPVRQWFAMSNADMELTRALYLAVLPAGVPSPLAPESDEEKPAPEAAGKNGTAAKNGAKGGGEKTPPRVTVDFDGLSERILALPVPAASYSHLQAGGPGQIYYLENGAPRGPFDRTSPQTLVHFDLDKREAEALAEGILHYRLSADHEKLLLETSAGWAIVGTGKVDPAALGKGKLATDAIQVKIDPRAEWAEIFDEAWRINRDYFYDPGMHGADWPAMRTKYAAFLPDLTTREDLNRVLGWMSSELAVGHHRVGGGDTFGEAPSVPGGLLGADYEIADGRYRLAKVYGGLNWNPELRSPLTEPGVDAKTGEYLLAVEGKELRPPENLYARFENTAGKIVHITLGPNPDGSGSRTVEVVPVEDESALRNRDWVEGNIRKVTEATHGRVAYVYVPNTASLGHTYFKRYFFPQADREAIIVDERHNGGGQVADYYIDLLRRPLIGYWATRYGETFKSPLASIQGPRVMLIDETAGSGGDLLPWMFHKLGLGPLIGRRTWGGLVGILGFPELMDGGFITAPNIAFWTPETGWAVENEGVPPDIEVEQLPAEVIAGHDPQLERAIEEVVKQLPPEPPATPAHPPYPVKAKP